MISYVVLLALALILNAKNKKMFVLSLVVGANIFIPIPNENFYLICILFEILTALLAYKIDVPASRVVIRISSLLVVFHALGYWFDGHPPESPYHILVKICEHSNLLACIIFSNKFIDKKDNNVIG